MKNLQSTAEGVWKSLDEIELTENDIRLANEVYTQYKPQLASEDKYQLISADVLIDDDSMVYGIINCRINGEHEQIRF
jgi:hypothetical protein